MQVSNSTVQDDHIYYNSTFYTSGSDRARDLWFDIAALNETEIIPETGISDLFRVYDVSLTYSCVWFKPFSGVLSTNCQVKGQSTMRNICTSDWSQYDTHIDP